MFFHWERWVDGAGAYSFSQQWALKDQEIRLRASPDALVMCKERFYRAMYGVLTAGVVSSGAYNAPFYYAEKEGHTEFLERCCAQKQTLSDKDVEYLRQFPVYDYDAPDESESGRWRDQEHEVLFGTFSEWLFEEGKRRGREKKLDPIEIEEYDEIDSGSRTEPESLDSAQAGAVREVKMLVAAYEHLHRKFTNGNREWGCGRQGDSTMCP
jgi:hypothetical protein